MISARQRSTKLDLRALGDLRRAIMAAKRTTPGRVHRLFKAWARRYREWASDRFLRLSRGGGEWAPLSPRTKKRISKDRYILIDSKTLLLALRPAYGPTPGQYEKISGLTVTVGYGGHARHPLAPKLTVQQIASFHQAGGARLPKREIIVDPPTTVVNDMVRMAQPFIDDWYNEHGPF